VSAWAQTLLQLLQTPPIDMGILLPYSALDDLTKKEGSVLGALLISKATLSLKGEAGGGADRCDGADSKSDSAGVEGAGFGETCGYEFASTLLTGEDVEQIPSSFDVTGGPQEAWQAIALALRYAPYGARIFATEGALLGADARLWNDRGDNTNTGEEEDVELRRPGSGTGLPLGSVRSAFPRLQTVSEARAIAAEARNLLVDPFMSENGVSSDDVDALGGSLGDSS